MEWEQPRRYADIESRAGLEPELFGRDGRGEVRCVNWRLQSHSVQIRDVEFRRTSGGEKFYLYGIKVSWDYLKDESAEARLWLGSCWMIRNLKSTRYLTLFP
jgi:hypothetical protein